MIVRFFFALIFTCTFLLRGATSSSRIVGGTATTIEQYPYQISLQREGFHICGGAIINNVWILSAGHCVFGRNYSTYSVRSGSSYHDSGGKLSSIKQIVVHTNFSKTTFDYDIAAIELTTPLLFNTHTIPIPLAPKSDFLVAGMVVTVTGWGRLSEEGFPSMVLRKVDLPLVAFNECAKAYEEHPISERMVCAGVPNVGGKDACQGDSGGPMVLDGKLIGIVSWGYGCAQPAYPGVYTRVMAFLEWVTSKTGLRTDPGPPLPWSFDTPRD